MEVVARGNVIASHEHALLFPRVPSVIPRVLRGEVGEAVNKKPRRSGVFREAVAAYLRTPLNSMSTRRFFWRPSAVLLVATGWDSPLPMVVIFEDAMPLLTR